MWWLWGLNKIIGILESLQREVEPCRWLSVVATSSVFICGEGVKIPLWFDIFLRQSLTTQLWLSWNSQSRPGWPPMSRDLPVSTSPVLILKVYAITPDAHVPWSPQAAGYTVDFYILSSGINFWFSRAALRPRNLHFKYAQKWKTKENKRLSLGGQEKNRFPFLGWRIGTLYGLHVSQYSSPYLVSSCIWTTCIVSKWARQGTSFVSMESSDREIIHSKASS